MRKNLLILLLYSLLLASCNNVSDSSSTEITYTDEQYQNSVILNINGYDFNGFLGFTHDYYLIPDGAHVSRMHYHVFYLEEDENIVNLEFKYDTKLVNKIESFSLVLADEIYMCSSDLQTYEIMDNKATIDLTDYKQYFYNPELLDEKFTYSEGTYPYYAIWWKVTYNNGYTASYICSIRYNVDGLKDKDYNARN